MTDGLPDADPSPDVAGTTDVALVGHGADADTLDGLADAAHPSVTDAGSDAAAAPSPCQIAGKTGTCIEVAACAGKATPGYCPGAKSIQCCTVAWACDESAHPQPNVGLQELPGDVGCPAGMVGIENFCIDRYEASLVEIDGAKPWSPYWNPAGKAVRAQSLSGAVPQGYIDGKQAAAACQVADKRLCLDTEWLRACRGPKKYTYPYGNALKPGVCNDHRAVHPAVEYYGTAASWIYGKIQNPCLNQLPASVAATGQHSGCATAEGVLDMMGNLHEWTADPAGTFRGGFYVDTKLNGPGCLYATTAHDSGHWDYSTGFRCCADRQP